MKLSAEDVVAIIKQEISWYLSCSGQISRDDMNNALMNMLRAIQRYEAQNPSPVVSTSKILNDDF